MTDDELNYIRLEQIHRWTMQRCYDITSTLYADAGLKGIRVCRQWHDKNNFILWCIENGYKGKDYYLRRWNIDRDFCPDNCYIMYDKGRPLLQRTPKRRRRKKDLPVDMRYQMGFNAGYIYGLKRGRRINSAIILLIVFLVFCVIKKQINILTS